MVPLSIRLILETEKEQNALKVLARLKRLFDFELQGLSPYFKGGFEANIVARLDDGPWPSVVLRALPCPATADKGDLSPLCAIVYAVTVGVRGLQSLQPVHDPLKETAT
jgi:hypothetical protein